MENKIKVGILGLGTIARKMALTVNESDCAVLYSVGSRSSEKAEDFAAEFGASKAYGSYEELAEDDKTELIYIATPHAFHFDNALMCLKKGKHVLIEKPAAVNARQAEIIFSYAKEKRLFAGEAMWSRFQPVQRTLEELIKTGAIGEVTCVCANTGGRMTSVPRLVMPELAGGALLDVGIYPLNFASMIINEPVVNITGTACLTDKGVDGQNGFILTYESGKMAILGSSMLSEMDSMGIVYGTEGRIEADGVINISSFKVINKDGIKTITRPYQHTGFEFELNAAVKAIKEGESEFPEMPHNETVKMLSIMDRLRSDWGVKYPFE